MVNINGIFALCRMEQTKEAIHMRVTKAQAQANRAHIVETASIQFREHGYDGVGVADLMAAAGFTHGGFYKHFGSKSDLMAESAACSISKTVEQSKDIDPAQFIEYYLSREHRDNPGTGCTMPHSALMRPVSQTLSKRRLPTASKASWPLPWPQEHTLMTKSSSRHGQTPSTCLPMR